MISIQIFAILLERRRGSCFKKKTMVSPIPTVSIIAYQAMHLWRHFFVHDR
jgi:hypothetical protein